MKTIEIIPELLQEGDVIISKLSDVRYKMLGVSDGYVTIFRVLTYKVNFKSQNWDNFELILSE